MLRDSDLSTFLKHFSAVRGKLHPSVCAPPDQVLPAENGLFASEVWRLSRSLQIAAVLGDAPPEAAIAAEAIAASIRGFRCALLENAEVWEKAIAWALSQNAPADAASLKNQWFARQQEVGLSCARLRSKGYDVKVGAYGPEVSEKSRVAIAQKIDRLLALVGGVEAAMQVCGALKSNNLLHDGMWLFGNRVPGIYGAASPAVPYGWLFSLSLRHFDKAGSARKPDVAWKTLITLATEFAASFDCQRYGQIEQFNIPSTEYYRAHVDSLVWRELFSLPQTPPQVLRHLKNAITHLLSPTDELGLGLNIREIFKEIDTVLGRAADDRLSVCGQLQAEREFPTLFRLSTGARGSVNVSYLGPLGGDGRNHERYLLFEASGRRVVILPRALTAAAACEFIFRLLRKLERSRADFVVGALMERVIEKACEGKAINVVHRAKYSVQKSGYEIDVATREGDRFVIFETKAKPLTAKSRSGNMISFFSDFTNSYLTILKQLVRHEIHLRCGLTPLTEADERVEDIRPLKIAVSPLSYGPVSDKFHSSSMLQSIVNSRLVPVQGNFESRNATEKFNRVVEDIWSLICQIAPRRGDEIDLSSYLHDVFWLDFGQLLYILDRSSSVYDAFQPLRSITSGSRDFWTEVALLDRLGVTTGKWRPIKT
ncbi:MAG: hypothetical protein Q8M26_00820 [Pseudolabrys sp.]|nr:hypothetical protein [Pseudolabrys sp.]